MKTRILTVNDLPNLEILFDRADRYQKQVEIKPWTLHEAMWQSMLNGQYLGCIFGEPSIRTRWSFTAAFERLGGDVISSFGPGSTSEEKGESLEDLIMTASQFVDFIVLRQSRSLQSIVIPDANAHIINAGDGNHEHPTQALLDAYTIWREFKRLEGLKIFIGGDTRQSRAIHSLIRILDDPKLGNKIYLCDFCGCPDAGDWNPRCEWEMVETYNARVHYPTMDVVYLNRMQWEREERNLDEFYHFGSMELDCLNEKAIIMNPGPRREEMNPFLVDKDPRSRFWDQVKNGMYIRMALFHHIMLQK